MGIINVLDKSTANLIAAGEVVERPASAIKELLENCADAGASNVTVEIKNGGSTYIRVTDDGCGMAKEDVPTSILRHATSKIRTKDDLAAIGTLGFRGEALAAISSVTRLSIMTKRACDGMGTLFESEFGARGTLTEAGCPNGTTIIARDLFENVPARRKFLKKDSTEAQAVLAAAEKFALSRPYISVCCISDGVQKLKTPGDGIAANCIYSALGRDFADGMISAEYSLEGISVGGFVCRPEKCRPNRSMQNFFINERYVRSRTMMAALEEGFRSYCPVGKFPGAVLYLTIDTSLVDVNIHPAKLEVKFVNERAVFEAVYYAVRNALTRGTSGARLFSDNRSEEADSYQNRRVKLSALTKAFPVTETVEKPAAAPKTESDTAPNNKDSPSDTQEEVSRESAPRARTIEEIAKIFDSEHETVLGDSGENRENGNKSREPPPPVASAEEHMKYIKSVSISVPSGTGNAESGVKKASGMAEKLMAEMGKRAEDIGVAKDGGDYLKGIEHPETVSVPKENVPPDEPVTEEPKNIPKAAVPEPEREKRPPAKPLESTISMLDRDDDGVSAISEKAELEKRVKRGVRIVGEVFNAYIVVEAAGCMYLVDKHAAHERIIYENMKTGKRDGGIQLLLEPVSVTISSKEAEAISEYGDYITKTGFSFEEFGVNTYLLRGLPPEVDISDGKDLFVFLAGQLACGNGRAVGDIFDKALYTAACKAAVKAGQKTSALSNAVIIDKLFSDESVLYCPHGRPVLIKFERAKLDRMFART